MNTVINECTTGIVIPWSRKWNEFGKRDGSLTLDFQLMDGLDAGQRDPEVPGEDQWLCSALETQKMKT